MKSVPKLINIDDFQSLKHLVFFKNETSQTELLDSTQFQMIELAEKLIIIEGPAKCAQLGHQVQLFILPMQKDLKLKKLPPIERYPNLIQIVGKVAEIEILSENSRVIMKIQFSQFNQDRWEALVEQYQGRQEQLEAIIKLGKG